MKKRFWIARLTGWTRRKWDQVAVLIGVRDKVDHSFYMFHAVARIAGMAGAWTVFENSLEIRATEGDPKTIRETTNATEALKNVTPIGRG